MNKINILCATDNNYVPYCGVMLTSLYENNRDIEITTYILTDELSEGNRNILSTLETNYHTKIEIMSRVYVNIFACVGGNISEQAHYYRCLVAEVLPSSVKKILYLDCDIIVTKPLYKLWNTDITNYAAAVVLDSGHFDERINFTGITVSENYFNSGVMLINIDYWRHNKIYNKCVNFINLNKDKLRTYDQDVLNAVLKDQVLYLPINYNFQDFYLFPPYFNRYGEQIKQQILQTRESEIAIYHLSMPVKPLNCWHCVYPFDAIWKQYKKISLWRHYPCVSSMKDRLMCAILRFCWKMGVKKTKVDFIEIQ